MQKLRREIEFLERGMNKVKTRLSKIQHDPLLTPMTFLKVIKPKQLIGPEYHNFPEYDQYTEHMIQEHDIQTEQNDMIERQIMTDASLSKQFQEEEKGQVL